MTGRVLPKSQWHFYFDRISKALAGKSAQIEVTGLRIGGQVLAVHSAAQILTCRQISNQNISSRGDLSGKSEQCHL